MIYDALCKHRQSFTIRGTGNFLYIEAEANSVIRQRYHEIRTMVLNIDDKLIYFLL